MTPKKQPKCVVLLGVEAEYWVHVGAIGGSRVSNFAAIGTHELGMRIKKTFFASKKNFY